MPPRGNRNPWSRGGRGQPGTRGRLNAQREPGPRGHGGRSNNAQQPPQPSLSNLFSRISVNSSVDDDEVPLRMPPSTPPPSSNRSNPGRTFNPQQTTLQQLKKLGSKTDASYPIRQAFADTYSHVHTNHFVLELEPEIQLHRYQILNVPANITKRRVKSLIKGMIRTTALFQQAQDKFASDYATVIISWNKLHEDGDEPEAELGPFTVRLAEQGPPIALKLRYIGLIDYEKLKKYTRSELEPSKNNEDAIGPVIKAINLFISKAIDAQSISPYSNKFFIVSGHSRLGESESLCTIRGYFYTSKPGMGQILLNMNTCTSAFFRDILVSRFLMDQCTFKAKDKEPHEAERCRMEALKGVNVYIIYERGRKKDNTGSTLNDQQSRIKAIQGFGKPVSEQRFTLTSQNGASTQQTVTVEAYLATTYLYTLTHPDLPAVNLGRRDKPEWYAPEHLQIVPYQLYKRTVPDHLTKSMLDVARRLPDTNRALIENEGLRNLGIIVKDGMVPFPNDIPLRIDPRMLRIPCGRLQLPRPEYDKKLLNLNRPQWNLDNNRFLRRNPATGFKLFVLAESTLKGRETTMNRYIQEIRDLARNKYGTASFTSCGSVIFGSSFPLEKAMAKAHEKVANFVLLIMEKHNAPVYSAFKNLADRRYGIHSLCILEAPNWEGNALKSDLSSYFGNVMMKINLKAGGINHSVEGVRGIMRDTLVLGADVTHSGPGSLIGTPSVAAIVGSVHESGGKFLGSMRLQEKENTEMIKEVKSMVLERLQDWFNFNNRSFPRNIIYYRDGVSEGQYAQVQRYELPQIRSAFAEIAKKVKAPRNANFNLTAIVVAKRHHSRFYPSLQDAAPKSMNCQPGTIVDSVVTSPYYKDFYLQSHNGLQGTAKMAHYFVLENEMKLTEKQIHEFTHRLCYTYVRATLGVSYAPPAYYADRLCERGRAYLSNFFAADPQMRNELDDLKQQWEKHAKDERNRQFAPRQKNGKGHDIKTDEEKKAEKELADKIDRMCRDNTLAKAKREFYRDGPPRNPWHPNIAKTMFWM